MEEKENRQPKIEGFMRMLQSDGNMVVSTVELDPETWIVKEKEIDAGFVGRGIVSLWPDDYSEEECKRKRFLEELGKLHLLAKESQFSFPMLVFEAPRWKILILGCMDPMADEGPLMRWKVDEKARGLVWKRTETH